MNDSFDEDCHELVNIIEKTLSKRYGKIIQENEAKVIIYSFLSITTGLAKSIEFTEEELLETLKDCWKLYEHS